MKVLQHSIYGPVMSAPIGEFVYDAFVSYSHHDKKWVEEVLLKALGECGVTFIIDDHHFESGHGSLDNMAAAVAQSRRTVLVLTPNWVSSPYANVEAQMVAGTDPAGWHGRMVPLLRKACAPPWWICVRSWLDFIDDARASAQMARLVRVLRRPISGLVRAEGISDRLRALSSLVSTGVLREAALRYRVGFEEIADRTRRVYALKAVHDQLDHLQRHCYDEIIRRMSLVAPATEVLDDATLEAFRAYAITLEEITEQLHQSEKEPVFANAGLGFVPAMDSALESLLECCETGRLDAVNNATRLLSKVLAVHPGRIDARLSEAACQAQLSRVIEAISLMYKEAETMAAGAAVVGELQKALNDLEELDDNVQELVRTHALWQALDLDLRLIDSNINPNDVSELTNVWPQLKQRVTVLSAAVPSIVQRSDNLATSVDTALAAKDTRLIISKFRNYKSRAGTRFTALDTNLKQQCEELVKAGNSVAGIVAGLQHDQSFP